MFQFETNHFSSARSLDSGIPKPRMTFEYIQAMQLLSQGLQ